jgi:hypothetical protein
MQQDVSPRRRRWPLILIVLIPVVAGIWSGAWYYAADRAETAIAGWREREAKAGRIHTCGSQIVSGFPFRFEMRCTDPGLELKSAQPPLSIKAKDILITARVWRPTLLTSEIAGPLTITDPDQSATITANWKHAQTEVRGLPTSPEQVIIKLDHPVMERAAGAEAQRLFNAERLVLSGRMLEGSAASNPVVEVALKLAAGVAPTLHPVTGIALDADITAVLRGLKDFSPKPWPARFREIQAAGGRIEIAHARIKQGETIAVANGELGLSPSGRSDGQLRLTVANLINLLPALGLDGRSPQAASKPLDKAADRLDRIAPGLGGIARQNAAPALVAGLNFIGQPAEIEGKRAITLPLRFNDGLVTLGPIPLGQTPPLF